jgi:hypothetical protein
MERSRASGTVEPTTCGQVALPSNLRTCYSTLEVPMGDKSPKSKQRDQKQKHAARVEEAAQVRSKQAGYSHTPATPAKVKK